MRRIEATFRKHTWLGQVCIGLIALYWVVGLTGFGKGAYLECKKDAETLSNRTDEETRQLEAQVIQTARNKLDQAEKLGKAYSPQMYFEDLAELDELRERLMVKHKLGVAEIKKMSELMQFNVSSGHFSDSEVSLASESYRYGIHDSDREEFQAELRALGWLRISQGLALFYIESIGLALLLFLVRMMERRGILETILADKKKFILALVVWPYFLYKYPHNVIREIIVEAELRRMGRLFRRLTASEKLWVRRIASSPDWRQSITAQGIARRGILVALAATVFMWLVPVLSTRTSRCLASTNEVRQQTVQAEARDGPSDDSVSHASTGSCGSPAILEDELGLDPPRIWTILREIQVVFRRLLGRDVEHIPLTKTAWHSTMSPDGEAPRA